MAKMKMEIVEVSLGGKKNCKAAGEKKKLQGGISS